MIKKLSFVLLVLVTYIYASDGATEQVSTYSQQRLESLHSILDIQLFKLPKIEKTIAMLALDAANTHKKEINIPEFTQKVLEQLQTEHGLQVLYKTYDIFDDAELHELRTIYENKTFQKAQNENFKVFQGQREQILHVIHELLDQYATEHEEATVNIVQQVTKQNIQDLLHSSQPIILKATASWCRPCELFAPTFSKIAQKFNQEACFASFDVDSDSELARQFTIEALPTVLFIKDGTVRKRTTGFLNYKELEQEIDIFIQASK